MFLSLLLLHFCWSQMVVMGDDCGGPCERGQYCEGDKCHVCPDGSFQKESRHYDTECKPCTSRPEGVYWIELEKCTQYKDAFWDCPTGYEAVSFPWLDCHEILIPSTKKLPTSKYTTGVDNKTTPMPKKTLAMTSSKSDHEGGLSTGWIIVICLIISCVISICVGVISLLLRWCSRRNFDCLINNHDRPYKNMRCDAADNGYCQNKPIDISTGETESLLSKSKEQEQSNNKENSRTTVETVDETADDLTLQNDRPPEKVHHVGADNGPGQGKECTEMKIVKNYGPLIELIWSEYTSDNLSTFLQTCDISSNKISKKDELCKLISKWEGNHEGKDILDCFGREIVHSLYADFVESREYERIFNELKGLPPPDEKYGEGEFDEVTATLLFHYLFKNIGCQEGFLNLLGVRDDVPFKMESRLQNELQKHGIERVQAFTSCGVMWVRWHRNWNHVKHIENALTEIGRIDILEENTYQSLVQKAGEQEPSNANGQNGSVEEIRRTDNELKGLPPQHEK